MRAVLVPVPAAQREPRPAAGIIPLRTVRARRDGEPPAWKGLMPASVEREVERIYRAESRRVLATLIRLLGDFGLAEEALQDAFTAALSQWSENGIPDNPRAWLVSAGRFKAIDKIR